MSLKLSVVIPAYNSGHRIGVPLEALLNQTTLDSSVEIVVVDSASIDDTAEKTASHPSVAAMAQKGVVCRVVREESKGLAVARLRGVLEARGELICFVEDDTAPAPEFLAEGLKAFSDPAVGLLVSQFCPRYEARPPASVLRREHLFGVNYKLGESVIDWGVSPTFAPTIGAGMWVRRDAFLAAMPWQNPEKLVRDRAGKSLGSGGDIEIGILVGMAGYKRVYWPGSKLWHVIPKTRFNSSYFCRLINGIVRSELTMKVRYMGYSHNVNAQAVALAKLGVALLASPLLLLRADGLREVLFVLASRWAQVKGPYTDASVQVSNGIQSREA